MKLFAVLFALVILAGNLSAESPAGDFFPYSYQKVELDNGLKAYLIPMEGSGLFAYYSVVRTGSRDEWEPGKSGFAHFFEHMMFRGTKKYPGNVYDKMVTEMGADANAYTTDDYTCYHMVAPREHLEKIVDIESDRFQNLFYEEREFRTEAGAVYGEYRKGRVNPYSVLLEELQNTAFDKHTYKHTTMGFERDIANMPNMYAYSQSFFNRYYRPENVVLIIAGDFPTEDAKKLIADYYGDWEKGYVSPQIKAEPRQRGERGKEIKYEGKTLPILWMSYKGDAFAADNRQIAAADLLADLAFGSNSELYKKLVLREQKVQYISSWFPYNRDPKLLHIYSMIKDPADIDYVKSEIDQTIDNFKTTAVEPEKLENLKKRVRYSFLMGLETPDDVAGGLARFVALTGGIEDINTLYANLEAVTAQDIQAAAQKYFQNNHRTVMTLKGE